MHLVLDQVDFRYIINAKGKLSWLNKTTVTPVHEFANCVALICYDWWHIMPIYISWNCIVGGGKGHRIDYILPNRQTDITVKAIHSIC